MVERSPLSTFWSLKEIEPLLLMFKWKADILILISITTVNIRQHSSTSLGSCRALNLPILLKGKSLKLVKFMQLCSGVQKLAIYVYSKHTD